MTVDLEKQDVVETVSLGNAYELHGNAIFQKPMIRINEDGSKQMMLGFRVAVIDGNVAGGDALVEMLNAGHRVLNGEAA